jgi:hypothetical protein
VSQWSFCHCATIASSGLRHCQIGSLRPWPNRFAPLFRSTVNVKHATGREGDDHAKVEDWIRKLVKPTLLERQKEAEVAALDAEWEEIALRDPMLRTKMDLQRSEEISNKIVQLFREREELWQRIFPHVRLYRPPNPKNERPDLTRPVSTDG